MALGGARRFRHGDSCLEPGRRAWGSAGQEAGLGTSRTTGFVATSLALVTPSTLKVIPDEEVFASTRSGRSPAPVSRPAVQRPAMRLTVLRA
jgi:hypothetical protein